MSLTKPKARLSKEEVIEILRRNARMFKDEPEFVAYIVELAMYLIENMLEQPTAKAGDTQPAMPVSPKEAQNIYRAFQRFTAGVSRKCPFCGAETAGRKKCPNCEGMTF